MPNSHTPTATQAKEPAFAELLDLLRDLPRFDENKGIDARQGDIPGVREAEKLYHSFNSNHQQRKFVEDKQGNQKSVMIRDRLLEELFQLADWKNFQRLLAHSTVGRERKKRANQKHRAKIKKDDAGRWLDTCRAKRRDRLRAWETEHHPRLLRVLAEADQEMDKARQNRLRAEVINELEARYTDEDRASNEYHTLLWRVLLGQFTLNGLVATHQRLEKLASQLWEHPETMLREALAQRLPPIIPDWARIQAALEPNLSAYGEND